MFYQNSHQHISSSQGVPFYTAISHYLNSSEVSSLIQRGNCTFDLLVEFSTVYTFRLINEVVTDGLQQRSLWLLSGGKRFYCGLICINGNGFFYHTSQDSIPRPHIHNCIRNMIRGNNDSVRCLIEQ